MERDNGNLFKSFGGLLITVQVRSHYGMDRIYPISELSKQLVGLTGRKTWSTEHLNILIRLGMAVEYLPQTFKVEE